MTFRPRPLPAKPVHGLVPHRKPYVSIQPCLRLDTPCWEQRYVGKVGSVDEMAHAVTLMEADPC